MTETMKRVAVGSECVVPGGVYSKIIYRDQHMRITGSKRRSLSKDRMVISKRRLAKALKSLFWLYIGFWVASMAITVAICFILF